MTPLLLLFVVVIVETSRCPHQCRCYNTQVNCISGKLTHIPHGIPKDTTILEINSNKLLTTIHRKDFLGLEKLKILLLTNNMLTFIGPKIFTSLTELKVLDLNGNNISKLHREAFFGLNKLLSSQLYANKLSSAGEKIF